MIAFLFAWRAVQQAAAPIVEPVVQRVTLDPTVITAAVVTVIAALVTGAVTIINALAASRDRQVAQQAREKLQDIATVTGKRTEDLVVQTAQIHTLTNSNLAKVTNALDLALQENASLKKLMATVLSSSKEAALLAASSAAAAVVAQQGAGRPHTARAEDRPKGPAELAEIARNTETLAQIETNTRDTADALAKDPPA